MKHFNILWLALCLAFTLSLASCFKPYDTPEFKEIKSNETAFLIPLTGKTSDQNSLQSEAYLAKNQLATKRVQLTHEWVQTGFGSNDGSWVPNVKLIVVDRTPVSVTWGAEDTIHRINVESSESIGYTPGVSVTAFVDESDAAKFLYKYAGKPLLDVVNSDVNNYVKGRFSSAFSVLTLEQAKKQKQSIFDSVYKDVVEHFKSYGVTVAQLGQTEGLTYDNKNIQEGIDQLAVNKAATDAQREANLKQDLENKRLQSVADTSAYTRRIEAQSFASNQTASIAQKQLEIELVKANAMLAWAEKGGQLPAIMPENVWLQSDFSKFGGNTPKKDK